jgi:hypothetical protein
MPLQTVIAAPCGTAFVPESRRARRRGRVDRIDQLLERFRRHVAAELGADAAGMHGRGADAPVLVPTVEFHREQDVGRLRP